MNLKRHAYKKPFSMKRYSTIEDNITMVIRNLIQMSEHNKKVEVQLNDNFSEISRAINHILRAHQ